MFWLTINGVAFVCTPAGLIWGWVAWAKRRHDPTRRRVAMSLSAVSAATLSLVILFLARFLSYPASRTLDRTGLFVAVTAVIASLGGYPRLVIPVSLASIGAITLWYGLTLS
jgi:hypothetical protein